MTTSTSEVVPSSEGQAQPMYACSLHRPWPWAFTGPKHDPKGVENRNSKPWDRVIGKRIAFHAAQRFDHRAAAHLTAVLGLAVPPPDEHPTGIVFTGLVQGWVFSAWRGSLSQGARWHGITREQAEVVVRSRWFFGPFGWVIDEVISLDEPVPCRGRQSLLWALPPDVEAQVRAQIGAGR